MGDTVTGLDAASIKSTRELIDGLSDKVGRTVLLRLTPLPSARQSKTLSVPANRAARKSATAYFNKALEIDTLCVPAHLHLAQLHLAGAPPRGTAAITACEQAVEQYDKALEKAKVAKHQQSDLIEICQLRVSASAKLEALKQQVGALAR